MGGAQELDSTALLGPVDAWDAAALRALLLRELCVPMDQRAAQRRARVAGVMGCVDTVNGSGGAVTYGFVDRRLAEWCRAVIAAPRAVRTDVHGDRIWMTVHRPREVLARFGYVAPHRWGIGLDSDSTKGFLQGVLAATASFSGAGMTVGGRDHGLARVITEKLGDLGLTAGPMRSTQAAITIPPGQVQPVLARLHAPQTGYAYLGLRTEQHEQSPHTTDAPRQQSLVNACRSQRAAAAEAQRIRALGDLNAYELKSRWRQAAELRRDRAGLSYQDLAEVLGVSKSTYTGLLRRFWSAVETQRRRSGNRTA